MKILGKDLDDKVENAADIVADTVIFLHHFNAS